MTLRRRLIIGIAALLAAVIVIIGVLTAVALRGFLVQRLDDQLANANGRSEVGFGVDTGGPPSAVGPILQQPGQSEGTLVALVRDGLLIGAGILDQSGAAIELSSDDVQGLVGLPLDGAPHSVTLGSEGEFRVISNPMPDGQLLVTGLPLREVNDTVLRLALLIGVIGLAGVAAAAVAGTVVVRRRAAAARSRDRHSDAGRRAPAGSGRGRARRAGPARRCRPAHRGRAGGCGAQPHARARRIRTHRAAGEREQGAHIRRRREP